MSWVAYVALGANLGERLSSLRRAATTLADHPDIAMSAASSIWESPAAPPADKEDPSFLNAVVRIQTRLSPRDLLDLLLSVEADLGRRRDRAGEGAPRTIDLDLLAHGDHVAQDPELTLPHPRIEEREFVLKPLAEVGGSDPRWAAALGGMDEIDPNARRTCVRRAELHLGVP